MTRFDWFVQRWLMWIAIVAFVIVMVYVSLSHAAWVADKANPWGEVWLKVPENKRFYIIKRRKALWENTKKDFLSTDVRTVGRNSKSTINVPILPPGGRQALRL